MATSWSNSSQPANPPNDDTPYGLHLQLNQGLLRSREVLGAEAVMNSRRLRLRLFCLLLCSGALPCWAGSDTVHQWQRQISAQVQSHLQFPLGYCGNGGRAKVEFTVDRAGKLISSKLAGGAGSPVLDKAALEVVGSAQPFPPAPPEATDDQLELLIPIEFKVTSPGACEAARLEAKKLQSVMHSICRGC
jgi:TonB family protein